MNQDQVVMQGRAKKSKLAVIFGILCVCFAVSTGVFAWKFVNNNGEIEETEGVDCSDARDAVKKDEKVNSDLETELRAVLKHAGFDVPTKDEAGPGETWVSLSLDGAEIENSSVAPWQTVSVSVGAYQGGSGKIIFYREGPDGEWIYGFSTVAAPECSDGRMTHTPNMIRAFADSECYEDGVIMTLRDNMSGWFSSKGY